jgi:hypothetical protein
MHILLSHHTHHIVYCTDFLDCSTNASFAKICALLTINVPWVHQHHCNYFHQVYPLAKRRLSLAGISLLMPIANVSIWNINLTNQSLFKAQLDKLSQDMQSIPFTRGSMSPVPSASFEICSSSVDDPQCEESEKGLNLTEELLPSSSSSLECSLFMLMASSSSLLQFIYSGICFTNRTLLICN